MSAVEKSPRIAPFLWFDKNAEEAVEFYLAIFKNSRRIEELRSPTQTTVPAGAILTITFELDGQRFVALNGGPDHKFNEAVSFFVRCETQEEIDFYWSKLSAGGSEIACGWLRDRYGLCWQVVPTRIMELVGNAKGMAAMMQMKKLDIAALERAAQG
jgi:predicted 3-demethylubiquinone-9 3-methyltransferase (glyoxalase superfamily)